MTANLLIDQTSRSYSFEIMNREECLKPGEFPFITISRESWALGRELAEKISAEIASRRSVWPFCDFKVYDRELCEKLASEKEMHVPISSLLSEEHHSSLDDYFLETMGGRTPQFKVMRQLMELIMELALAGRCIIVGRGGSHITRNLPGGVHLRLVAPMDKRIRNMAAFYDIDKEAARKRIEKQDHDKAAFFKEYFHREISDPLLYDAVYNTDRVSLKVIASQVIDILEARHETIIARRKQ